MGDIFSNGYFKKEADNYFCKKEKYASKIIDLALKDSYSIDELLAKFNSKPTFYAELKRLRAKKIINYENNKLLIGNDFKAVLNCYSFYYALLKCADNDLKNQDLKEKMLGACEELGQILGL
jgi:hypothetical protein